jgi:hydrogenase-4 component F
MFSAFLAAPFVAALVGFGLPWHRARIGLLIGFAVTHLAAVGWFWGHPPAPVGGEILALDALGLLMLTVMSAVFAVVALYTPGYLKRKGHPTTRTYVACSLALLGAMSLAASTRHFGVLWVAIEASTLASAPLVSHRLSAAKLEATWKYLLLCSVGVALALLGTFFLGIGATTAPRPAHELTVTAVTAAAPVISIVWLRVAFVLLLVGYGTKMGLAPLHFWLPDAYSEAPSPASALFSGALSNAAFLGVLRVLPVMTAAGQGPFARNLLVLLGFVSLAVAAGFIFHQRDLKRMMAYSSVENYGILALGVGLGGIGSYGALLHAVNHALVKTLLFLVAGNVLVLCGTRSVGELRGLAARAPRTGALLAAGFLAIAGTPPFGPFWSEFTVLRAALDRPWLAVLYLGLLGVVFVGMALVVLRVLHGARDEAERPAEPWSLLGPPALLLVGVLALGVVIPAPLEAVLRAAASSLGG